MAASDLNTDETRNLISADKVEGTTIYDRQGSNIGTANEDLPAPSAAGRPLPSSSPRRTAPTPGGSLAGTGHG